MGRAIIVSFEGGEGTGKSTQLKRFAQRLENIGLSVLTLREPGGVHVSELIRDLIVFNEMDPLTELLLYIAARAELFKRKLVPALSSYDIVILDRSSDSTIAYQGYARGLSIDKVKSAIMIATDGIEPQLTFLLDIDPAIGLSRSKQVETNKFEDETLDFQQKVREGYRETALGNPKRIVVIDALPARDEVEDAIWQSFKQHFPSIG